MCVGLILTKLGFEWYFISSSKIFWQLSENKIVRQLQGGSTINFLLTNCSFHTKNILTTLYVRPLLDYGDLIYRKDDPEVSLSLTKKVRRFVKLLKRNAPKYTTAPVPRPEHLSYSLREENVFESLATRTQSPPASGSVNGISLILV